MFVTVLAIGFLMGEERLNSLPGRPKKTWGDREINRKSESKVLR